MDFFEAQERARRRTGWLIVLFGLAVCGTVTAVYAAAKIALHCLLKLPLSESPAQFWEPALFWRIAVHTLALIIGASIYKTRAAATDTVRRAGLRPFNPGGNR